MKKSFLMILLSAVLACSACLRQQTYSFNDFSFDYPDSYSVQDEELYDNMSSFFLRDSDAPENRIEMSIYQYDEALWSTIPDNQVIGEMIADIDEMTSRVAAAASAAIISKGRTKVTSRNSLPSEASATHKLMIDGKTTYLHISSMAAGTYTSIAICRAETEKDLECQLKILSSRKVR